MLLACLLAKIHNPAVDIRKPYTEIGTPDAFSGRSYDEQYITAFVLKHELPCNPTTAFLTPALRNRNTILTPEVDLVGRPKEVYKAALDLLNAVYTQKISAEELLAEAIRWLLVVRDERQQRMESLLSALRASQSDLTLSSEAIVNLIEQHLALRNTSRLPVLIIAAIYQVMSSFLDVHLLPLQSHNAADRQTHALGDVQIMLRDELGIRTAYEVKMKRVTRNDIDQALQKILHAQQSLENYIFITTEHIDDTVKTYAAEVYEQTSGIEFVVLDCLDFLRYFLHLFHHLRVAFLDTYQSLVLAEPDSAVNQPLKEALLALRHAAESGE